MNNVHAETLKPENIVAKSESDWKKARIVLVLVLILAALSGIFYAANLLRFELLTDAGSIISILTPLILYSIFVERAVEVFLTVWRGREADALALAVEQESKKVKLEKNQDLGAYNVLQTKLLDYKATTRDIAFVSSFIVGMAISLAGVRALALFVDPSTLDDLSWYQTLWFTVVDIFITGALIGGGSDGMHKVVSMIIALLDSTKARALQRSQATEA